jgi:FkbM family methyltransferase
MDDFWEKYGEITSEIPNCGLGKAFARIKEDLAGRPLVLCGLWQLTSVFWQYCQEFDIPVACVVDTEKTGMLGDACGVPVVGLDRLVTGFPGSLILICSIAYNNKICNRLLQNGFSPDQIIPCPASYQYAQTQRTFARYLKGYAWAYGFFEDVPSRQLILDRMRLYLLEAPLSPNTNSDCYYEDGFISLSDSEVFVDGGAWEGDSAEAFIKKMQAAGKTYSRIYSFEPSANICAKTQQRLAPYPSIEIIQKGQWASETNLQFFDSAENSAGSCFVAEGSMDGNVGGTVQQVPLTSLDAVFANASDAELPTFIKMDIEGSEKGALLGAARSIMRKKPKLAICAYHKIEDIYELPQTILGIRDDYRFALRQHYAGCWDTVLYAV